MIDSPLHIKLSYIPGLKPVVLNEVNKAHIKILNESDDAIFVEFSEEIIQQVKAFRSISRAYLVLQNELYNPGYISHHKSILGTMIELVIPHDTFKTFKISCAGSDSPEARSIAAYIQDTYKLKESDDADLKIHIIKPEDVWEIGIQITPRPLSVRTYRSLDMAGAMDATIAYAVNSFGNLDTAKSYLNIFSGSGTLLIEAGLQYPNIERLIGFDNDKKHLSLSIQNIKKAGLIERIKVKEADIHDKPDFSMFDVIVSDLPFGMLISKDEDLGKLYETFIQYCEGALNPAGRLIVYTSQFERIETIIRASQFKIVDSLQLRLVTNVGAYLKTRVIVCERS